MERLTPHVEFYICNLNEVSKQIFSFRKEFFQPVKKTYPSVNLSLSQKIVERIKHEKSFSSGLKEELVNNLKKIYPEEKEMLAFKESLEKEWFRVNDLFFEEINKKCSFEWEYKVYRAGIVYGLCSHYGQENQVYVAYWPFKENKFFYPAFALAEEIFHLGYWDFFKNTFNLNFEDCYNVHFPSEKFSIWQISELFPEYYLKEHPFINFKWNQFDRTSGYYWMPELKKIADKLKKKSVNFKEFMIALHRECGCLPKLK